MIPTWLEPDLLAQEAGIEMAVDKVRKMSATEEVHWIIEDRMKAVRDQATRMERARQEGREEGMRQAMEEGRLEALREVARKCLEARVDPEIIRRVTGLDPATLDE